MTGNNFLTAGALDGTVTAELHSQPGGGLRLRMFGRLRHAHGEVSALDWGVPGGMLHSVALSEAAESGVNDGREFLTECELKVRPSAILLFVRLVTGQRTTCLLETPLAFQQDNGSWMHTFDLSVEPGNAGGSPVAFPKFASQHGHEWSQQSRQAPPRAEASSPRKICIVIAELPSPAMSHLGAFYRALAFLLADAGHYVTVLYVGDVWPSREEFKELRYSFASHGVFFTTLQPPAILLKGSLCVQRAYRTYEWLKERDFDWIHFHDRSGCGYFAALAKTQGLAFSDTSICVGLLEPGVFRREHNRDMPEEASVFEADFMERESLLLADVTFSCSAFLPSWFAARGFQVPSSLRRMPCLPDSAEVIGSGGTGTVRVSELVFLGNFEFETGLVIFCDALDALQGREGVAFEVTFLGAAAEVDGKESLEYLALRSARWRFPWKIEQVHDVRTALEYLRLPGRLAVLPYLGAAVPWMVAECLAARIPFLASAVGSMAEALDARDTETFLVPPDARSLCRALEQALVQGMPAPGARVSVSEARDAWVRFHAADPLPAATVEVHCPRAAPPLVSVCLTEQRDDHLLLDAIGSVCRQTYPHIELIVAGEAAAARAAVARERFAESNISMLVAAGQDVTCGAALNRAARLAKGRWLLLMNGAQELVPGAVATLVEVAVRRRAEILTSCFETQVQDLGDRRARRKVALRLATGGALSASLFFDCFGGSCCLVERDIFFALGSLSEDVGAEIREFYSRALLHGRRLEIVPEVMYRELFLPERQLREDEARWHRSNIRAHRRWLPEWSDLLLEWLVASHTSSQKARSTGHTLSALGVPHRQEEWLPERILSAGARHVVVNAERGSRNVHALRNVLVAEEPDGLSITVMEPGAQLLLSNGGFLAGETFGILLCLRAPDWCPVTINFALDDKGTFDPEEGITTHLGRGFNRRFLEIPDPKLTGFLRLDFHSGGRYKLEHLELCAIT